jgi:hypothetical protein
VLALGVQAGILGHREAHAVADNRAATSREGPVAERTLRVLWDSAGTSGWPDHWWHSGRRTHARVVDLHRRRRAPCDRRRAASVRINEGVAGRWQRRRYCGRRLRHAKRVPAGVTEDLHHRWDRERCGDRAWRVHKWIRIIVTLLNGPADTALVPIGACVATPAAEQKEEDDESDDK